MLGNVPDDAGSSSGNCKPSCARRRLRCLCQPRWPEVRERVGCREGADGGARGLTGSAVRVRNGGLGALAEHEVLELTAALTERTAALDRAYREREDAVLRYERGRALRRDGRTRGSNAVPHPG